jgi:Esterase/lipase
MNWFKRLLNFRKKPTFVLIHGFGIRTINEYDFLVNIYNQRKYHIYCPKLFDPLDEGDDNWKDWLQRAEDCIAMATSKSDDIYLVGYSMGGVIATYLSTKYKVKKLILLAPAFEYINLSNATTLLTSFVKNDPPVKKTEMPTNFFPEFMNLVNELRDSVKDVSVPTLIFQGSDDKTISPKVAKKYYKLLPLEEKRLLTIEGATHRLIDDVQSKNIIVNLIDAFMENRI